MSALTGNQIKDTYQGLLKLADSSTGITSSFQAVQDGLGNDTGLRIATGQLESDNIPSLVALKSRYYGNGFQPNGNQFPAGTQNIILANPFYDNGNYSYSAFTTFTFTTTTTSDTVELAIYTSQMINPFGLYPSEPIISGITADTTTTGQKTFVFPTPISMSGYGAGLYWLVFKISNGGAQPTYRPGQASVLYPALLTGAIYGVNQAIAANTFQSQPRGNNANGTLYIFTGATSFGNPFGTNIASLQSSATTTGNPFGFILHTVDA